MAARSRVVVAIPDPTERDVIATWLSSEGFEPVRAATAPGAMEALRASPFDLLISDHALAFRHGLHAAGRGRARHAHTPVVVIGDADHRAQTEAESRGASYVVRPADRATLMCIIGMALADERPLRRSPRKAINFEAISDGVPCRLVDVSNEGLRLEMPRDRKSPVRPYFSVRVPMIGATIMAQRIWVSPDSSGARSDRLWCGSALVNNARAIERVWQSFVDAIPTRAVRA